ncbi:hypothetical protein AABB24_006991, partial [Solanum stoloniferum]
KHNHSFIVFFFLISFILAYGLRQQINHSIFPHKISNCLATMSNNDQFMLFGVRMMEGAAATGGSFRKSASMNNLALLDTEQQHQDQSNTGYASDDVVHPSARSRERKRGVAWTEEEHKLFLLGLQKVGKGDWRGISRNFVKTRTPTQVASHAQKYFLRRNNSNRRRRRSSLFDITTDTVQGAAKLEDNKQMIDCRMSAFRFEPPVKLPVTGESSSENFTIGMNKSMKPIRPIPALPVPPSSKMADLNLNLSTPSRHSPAFQPAMSGGFSGSTSGDSIISVA